MDVVSNAAPDIGAVLVKHFHERGQCVAFARKAIERLPYWVAEFLRASFEMLKEDFIDSLAE